jgi:hypothetical protein
MGEIASDENWTNKPPHREKDPNSQRTLFGYPGSERRMPVMRPRAASCAGKRKSMVSPKECLAFGKGHDDEVRDLKLNPISESNAQMLKKVEELLTRPDSAVYLAE